LEGEEDAVPLVGGDAGAVVDDAGFDGTGVVTDRDGGRVPGDMPTWSRRSLWTIVTFNISKVFPNHIWR